MVAKVALVELRKDARRSLEQAMELIGGTDDLNTSKRTVVTKLGVYDHRQKNHATATVVEAIVDSFDRAPRILLAEADNYRGTGLDRLQIWKKLFNDRVVPFNLSDDVNTRAFKVVDEDIQFSSVLFKPNVLLSVHVLRGWAFRGTGSTLKNLLGLIPDRKKARFHRKGLAKVLTDIYEGVGGIDLSILDGTYAYAEGDRIRANLILVGRDATAVDVVGGALMGVDPKRMPVVQESVRRGLGEGNMERIEVVGYPMEEAKAKIMKLLKAQRKKDK
jgi:uncharacterized protein (DUF362 family)